MIKVLSGKAIVQVACGVTHSIALSDYRRISGKAARLTGAAPTGKNIPQAGSAGNQDVGADAKMLDASETPKAFLARIDELGAGTPSDLSPEKGHGGSPEKGLSASKDGLPHLISEREVAFLNAELKAYQEQTLRLAKLLQETRTKLEALQNENSFLKSELEVMHQCSNDADERLDTLRHHFNERIREMERRYNDKERAWRETFGRLRSHLGLGGDVAHADAPGGAAMAGGAVQGQDTAEAAAAAVVALAEAGTMGPLLGDEEDAELQLPTAQEASAAANAASGSTSNAAARSAPGPSEPSAAGSGTA
eukprot:TRINITY_DN27232_c0_g1_i2.p1 TRINITY_DN27232_c0_g1~~TRINITY_DN27232_c0_g1_i2.p1  ORF type:complete len:308 (+),score=98.88 TRINITY_DN27232_c0_g1_i2:215-1138(+)